ncbi:Uncharacterised protein [Kingella denitrificans]|uniref:Uncharacterized protein n=1 Tax=Kingella denitrificans ATCC 33394 TaxID=888741 RepID=F0F1J7_9NEIS|nr:hypothetical protein HMPREF9098_1982 [Kingella denitrificans ATCC 33394]STR11651.1 Uncharacterised protein [Kingella denitrificans]
MRQGGEPQGVQVVRQGEPTPYHCNFNPLYLRGKRKKSSQHLHCQSAGCFLIYATHFFSSRLATSESG